MRVREVESHANRACAASNINDARRLRRFAHEICERGDGDGGADSVGFERDHELCREWLVVSGMRAVVFVLASYGGVVYEGVETWGGSSQ